MTQVLSVNNVSFHFEHQHVLDDISFGCDMGETVGIVGRSGIGKSTLLNLICGFAVPSSGSVAIAGSPAAAAARNQNLAYVFQEPTLLPWLTVRRNVSLPLEMDAARRGNPNEQDVAAAMTSAHISHAADKYPHELSGGMQTRASIARAIVMNPKLVLADEPFAALDDITKEALYQDLESILLGRGIAMVLVTHSLIDAVMLSDRVLVLGPANDGAASKILYSEPIELARPRTTDVIESKAFQRARRRIREAMT